MSHLLINEPPLQVLPSLAVKIGLNEAIVLQQIHYWLGRSKTEIDGHRWVYNTVQQWREQFPFWSDDTIGRALKNLREKGVVVAERLSKNGFDRTLYYRIEYRILRQLEHASCGASNTATCGNGEAQIASLSSTETTQETSTERPHKAAASRGTTLRVWLESLKTSGAEAVPATDAVFTYAAKAGIPDSFLALAWTVFKADHIEGSGAKKLQKDWRQTFRNYVEKNYLKLWYVNAEGVHVLTTPGIQAQRVYEVAA